MICRTSWRSAIPLESKSRPPAMKILEGCLGGFCKLVRKAWKSYQIAVKDSVGASTKPIEKSQTRLHFVPNCRVRKRSRSAMSSARNSVKRSASTTHTRHFESACQLLAARVVPVSILLFVTFLNVDSILLLWNPIKLNICRGYIKLYILL